MNGLFVCLFVYRKIGYHKDTLADLTHLISNKYYSISYMQTHSHKAQGEERRKDEHHGS